MKGNKSCKARDFYVLDAVILNEKVHSPDMTLTYWVPPSNSWFSRIAGKVIQHF